MNQFVKNPTDFSEACRLHDGQCEVVRENILFLDDGEELDAVDNLQRKCGSVVIVPDPSQEGQALLYHTSCQRMTDAVKQIFEERLEAPVRLPQHVAELSLGELHRRAVALSYDDCRARVEAFGFQGASRE